MAVPRAVYVVLALFVWVVAVGNAKLLHAIQNNNFTMYCDQNEPSASWWILPNQKIVSPKQPFDTRIFLNDSFLYFKSVESSDEGPYSCAFLDGDQLVLRSVRLQVEPVLETGEVWKRYKSSFVTGLAASGVVAGIIVFLVLVYRYKWKNPRKKLENSRDGLMPPSDIEGSTADARF